MGLVLACRNFTTTDEAEGPLHSARYTCSDEACLFSSVEGLFYMHKRMSLAEYNTHVYHASKADGADTF